MTVAPDLFAPAPALIPQVGTVAPLLKAVPTGERRALPQGGTFEATASYVVPDGICRSFLVSVGSAATRGWRGVACRHEGAWDIEMVAADRGAAEVGETYSTASDPAVRSVDAFLDAVGASGSLDAAEERRLVENGWRTDASKGEEH